MTGNQVRGVGLLSVAQKLYGDLRIFPPNPQLSFTPNVVPVINIGGGDGLVNTYFKKRFYVLINGYLNLASALDAVHDSAIWKCTVGGTGTCWGSYYSNLRKNNALLYFNRLNESNTVHISSSNNTHTLGKKYLGVTVPNDYAWKISNVILRYYRFMSVTRSATVCASCVAYGEGNGVGSNTISHCLRRCLFDQEGHSIVGDNSVNMPSGSVGIENFYEFPYIDRVLLPQTQLWFELTVKQASGNSFDCFEFIIEGQQMFIGDTVNYGTQEV